MKLRVLHLLHWPRSGIGTLVGDLLRLAPGDTECHVIGLEGEGSDYDLLRDGSASLESLRLSSRGPVAIHRLWRRIRELRPHVIHSHSFLPGVSARLVGSGCRLLTTVHNAYPYFQAADLRSRVKREVEIHSLRWRPVRVTCVSDGVRATLPAGWPQADVVENGVMIERVRRLAMKRTVRRDSAPLIVAAGRLEAQKGYDLLIDAMARVRREIPAQLMLVGEGSRRTALEQQSHALGLDGAVRFLGYQENPFPYLRAADLYVSSSRYEGFGQSVLEAMSLGIPVVTTATAGMGEILRDGETGFLAPRIDAPAIAEAIVRALGDRTRLARVGRAGTQLVEQSFPLERTSQRYHAIYREMIG